MTGIQIFQAKPAISYSVKTHWQKLKSNAYDHSKDNQSYET